MVSPSPNIMSSRSHTRTQCGLQTSARRPYGAWRTRTTNIQTHALTSLAVAQSARIVRNANLFHLNYEQTYRCICGMLRGCVPSCSKTAQCAEKLVIERFEQCSERVNARVAHSRECYGTMVRCYCVYARALKYSVCSRVCVRAIIIVAGPLLS